MVSFSCEGCGDVLTKKKLDPHRNQCYNASFTCIDCMVHFQGMDYRSHTSCMSEAQKYQGALYRPEKEKKKNNSNNRNSVSKALAPHKAYVEDEMEEVELGGHNSHIIIVDPPMPHAPSPPPAAPGFTMERDDVNVFDFLVDSETPNASRLELGAAESQRMIDDGRQEPSSRDLVRASRHGDSRESLSNMIEYGSGPITAYQTPAPKGAKAEKKERKETDTTKSSKKDKKRKTLHVEIRDVSPRPDEGVADAPPLLHSGLTGGLNRLLRPSAFPPSPDYSGDAGEPSPGSPLKKSKQSKRNRVSSMSTNIMSLIKTRDARDSSHELSEDRAHRRQRRHRDHSERAPPTRLLEHKAANGADDLASNDSQTAAQMVVYQPRAELLLNFINKGPESGRGISMNKALKRYHRERHAVHATSSLSRAEEEKELWKSLRLKKNERGEIVLFLA